MLDGPPVRPHGALGIGQQLGARQGGRPVAGAKRNGAHCQGGNDDDANGHEGVMWKASHRHPGLSALTASPEAALMASRSSLL